MPIVNYPETAILGLGRIEDQPVVRDGKVVIRKILPLSVTYDHRVVDGAEAARFINVIIEHLEDPGKLLVESKLILHKNRSSKRTEEKQEKSGH